MTLQNVIKKKTHTVRLSEDVAKFLHEVKMRGLSLSALIELLVRREMIEKRIISNLLDYNRGEEKRSGEIL